MILHVVRWLDAICEIGWVEDAEALAPAPCTSVGFLVKHDDQGITLAQTRADDGENCNLICVPAGMIVSVESFEVGSDS